MFNTEQKSEKLIGNRLLTASFKHMKDALDDLRRAL
jgi:hypothetical protein